LPSARPLPGPEECFVPAEGIVVGMTPVLESPWPKQRPEDVPPYIPPEELPPPELPPDVFLMTFRSQDVNVPQNKFTIGGHGIANGELIRFAAGAAGTLPSPIVEGEWYYVINAATNSFQISTAIGGSPFGLTDVGTGQVNEIWRQGP
jgi:hypothetical protein